MRRHNCIVLIGAKHEYGVPPFAASADFLFGSNNETNYLPVEISEENGTFLSSVEATY
jgi:hypothetical protein